MLVAQFGFQEKFETACKHCNFMAPALLSYIVPLGVLCRFLLRALPLPSFLVVRSVVSIVAASQGSHLPLFYEVIKSLVFTCLSRHCCLLPQTRSLCAVAHSPI